MAFKELASRQGTAAAELKTQLRAPDRSSFLGLLALRQMGSAYRELDAEFRVAVLVDALGSSRSFNTWGLPHLYWEDAARAIIDEGPQAEKALLPLLADARPAPSWGSEQAMEYRTYQYRVSDCAWALLRAIRGETGIIPTNPKDRDELIKRVVGGRPPR